MMEKEQELWKERDDAHTALLNGCVEFERVRRSLVVNQKSQARLEAGRYCHANDSNGNGARRRYNYNACSTRRKNRMQMEQWLSVQSVKKVRLNLRLLKQAGVSHSAAMSQMVILPEDVGVSDSVLPEGLSDINGQQLDLRTSNSWLLKMEEVSTPEIMECMFINAIAPFVSQFSSQTAHGISQ